MLRIDSRVPCSSKSYSSTIDVIQINKLVYHNCTSEKEQVIVKL